MKGKKSSHLGLWLVMATIAIISYIAFMGAMKDGITLNSGTKDSIDNVESIGELKDTVSFELNIPSYVTETTDELNIKTIAGQIVSINTTKFVFRASSFVNVKADVLGLYEKANTDETYSVNNSNIIYFKYRQGYIEYPNCTIINWCTNKTSYGLMIEDSITFDESLKIIGISRDNLSKYIDTDEEATAKEDNNITVEYTIDDQLSIKIPEFKGNITNMDTGGVTAFYSNDTLLFLVVYNKKDIQEGTYSEQSVVGVSDNIKIYYSPDNPCEKNSDAYSDYELMLSTIEDIGKTVRYK